MNETLIRRAVTIVGMIGTQEAAQVLMQSGVTTEDAFLAAMAAAILVKDAEPKGDVNES